MITTYKKIILFIVEGKNDEREISAMLHTDLFEQYKDLYEPYFIVMNSDITADKNSTSNNIKGKLNEIILKFRRSGVLCRDLKVSDFQEIIQVIDIDGVFIPNENIERGEFSSFDYTDNSIVTSNVDGAIGRNKKKRDIIYKLLDTDKIDNIPYRIYFVSCNMDHLLFDERVLTVQQKNKYSMEFQCKCDEDKSYVRNNIFVDDIAINKKYDETWNYIQEECNSLKRKTNLHLFFDIKNK